MSDYLKHYEIQHPNTDFEKLINYLQDAVKENKLQITKEVVEEIINITNKQELFEEEFKKSYEEGYSEGYKDGKVDGKEDAEEDAYSDGYNEGHSDGYEKAKAEFENPNIKKLKQEIEDEYYKKGYISTDVYYQKIVPNREPNFNNRNRISPDDLPF